MVELSSLGQPALAILAGPLLPQGCRPGCSVSRLGVGSQVPSTLASSHREPARHSGGRSNRERSIPSGQGCQQGGGGHPGSSWLLPQEAQAGEGWGLWPPQSPGYSLEDKESESSPFLLVLLLPLGSACREARVHELKVSVLGRHCG